MAKSKRAPKKASDDLFPELAVWVAEQDRIAAEAHKDWNTAIAALPPRLDE